MVRGNIKSRSSLEDIIKQCSDENTSLSLYFVGALGNILEFKATSASIVEGERGGTRFKTSRHAQPRIDNSFFLLDVGIGAIHDLDHALFDNYFMAQEYSDSLSKSDYHKSKYMKFMSKMS